MSLYSRECERCDLRTTHEDSHPGDKPEEFVSVYEHIGSKFLYCRLCERGHSPADNEIDKGVVEEIVREWPDITKEAQNGARDAKKFLHSRIRRAHEREHPDKHFHPKTTKALTERYLDL